MMSVTGGRDCSLLYACRVIVKPRLSSSASDPPTYSRERYPDG